MIVERYAWKLHPQPSSLRKARTALKSFYLEGKTVLDPFCGTGTLLIAAKEAGARVIGSDIEDWSNYIRPEAIGIEFHWGIDAFEAVQRFEHNVLLTDPPNPKVIVGGRLLSAYRDTGVSGSQLIKMLKLSESNLMGKKFKTIKSVIQILKYELEHERIIIINAFNPYKKYLSPLFNIEQIFDSYYIVKEIKRR